MKVGINATCLNDRPSGARQRFVGIYGALIRSLPNVEFTIYNPQDCKVSSWFADCPNVVGQATPVPSTGGGSKQLAAMRFWPGALRKSSFDIFEGMHLPLFKPANTPAILTIHDVRDLHPEHSTMNRFVYTTVLRQALRKADHVITVSAAMRAEILDFYPHKSVSVVYNGFDSNTLPSVTPEECDAFLRKFDLPSTFVLSVGHLERRKNYRALIQAMALLRDRGMASPLLIVGNDSGEGQALAQEVESQHLTGQVKLLSGLTDRELRCAYALCDLFVFPSAYEGFGIPILEAMAANRPMALSDLPVFREISEGQAIYFPHDGVEAMASAIEQALTSTEQRERMVQYGVQRVKNFGFEHLAKEMATLYEVVKHRYR
jgi:glycosyltransferase involved in cell wall biosynthesis